MVIYCCVYYVMYNKYLNLIKPSLSQLPLYLKSGKATEINKHVSTIQPHTTAKWKQPCVLDMLPRLTNHFCTVYYFNQGTYLFKTLSIFAVLLKYV